MFSKNTLVLFILLSHIGIAKADSITVENGSAISTNPDILDHLGIQVNVSAPIESETEYVAEPAPSNEIPRPRLMPESVRRARDAAAAAALSNDTGGAATGTRQQRTAAATTPTEDSSGQTTAAATNPNGQNNQPTQNQNYNNYNQNTGTAGTNSTGGSTYPTFNSPSITNSGGGSQLVQGFLYSNDDSGTNAKSDSSPTETPTQSVGTNNALLNGGVTQPTVTATDKKSKSSKTATTETPFMAAGQSSGSAEMAFGSFSGSKSGNTKGTVQAASSDEAPAQEALKKMWNGYHGASGRRGGGRAPGSMKASLDGRTRVGRNLASISPESKLLDPRTVLEARLKRIQQRGIASIGELEKSDNFLFFSMCQHYVNYAEKNRINTGKTECPAP